MLATEKLPGIRSSLLDSSYTGSDLQAFLARECPNPDRFPHFVGNLNVFVTRKAPVERHIRRAVGFSPDRPNMAMFCIGDGRPDRYTLTLEAPPSWEAMLLGAEWGKPVELSSGCLRLVIVPPTRADSGRIAVWVDRESTREKVPVEFELDVRPGGAKCYFF